MKNYAIIILIFVSGESRRKRKDLRRSMSFDSFPSFSFFFLFPRTYPRIRKLLTRIREDPLIVE